MKNTPEKKTAGGRKPAASKNLSDGTRPNEANSTTPAASLGGAIIPDTQKAHHKTGRSTPRSRIDLEELLTRIDLAQLAENKGVQLTYKRGRGEYRGRCPFHNGQNQTAFQIYQGQAGHWRWKCWACDEGGDALSFVQKSENIADFLEAARWLADWGHIPLADIGLTPEAEKQVQARQARMDILDLAAKFAAAQLWSPMGDGAEALAYARSRGFTDDLIRLAGFGFLNGSTKLRDHLEEADADMVLARKLGLVRKDGRDFTANAQGCDLAPTGWLIYAHRPYPQARKMECEACETATWHVGADCLRHAESLRHVRRVNYLSARALAPTNPKDKSRNLPGTRQLYKAEVPGVREVIICEGPADAESYRQLGFSAWALCGLGSLSPADLVILRRRPVIYIALDGDEEGQKKQGQLAQEIGPLAMLVPSIDIPVGETEDTAEPQTIKDANAWLQAGATAADVRTQLELATIWIEEQLDRITRVAPYELPQITDEIMMLLQDLPKALEPRYLQKAQRRLGMNRRELRALMNEAAGELDADGNLPTLAEIKNGRLCFLDEPLGNFYMCIDKEVAFIDGLNMPEARYAVSGGLATGETFPQVEVNAQEFAELQWVGKYWGARPILYIPRSKYYLFARAVQEVSLATMERK